MKKKIEVVKYQGLCFRCEWRALSLEKKGEPRCECGMHNIQVCGCYMFKPVRPVVTQVSPGYEDRPRYGPAIISARERGVELLDGVLTVVKVDKKKSALVWVEAVKKCKKHPRYKGLKKPTSKKKCCVCKYIYNKVGATYE